MFYLQQGTTLLNELVKLMKIKVKTNLVFGIFAIIVAIVLAILSFTEVKKSTVIVEYIDGRFFPLLCSAIMGLSGVFCLFQSIFRHKPDEKIFDFEVESKVIIYLLIVLCFGLIARYLSFLVASILIGAVSLAFFGCKDWKKYLIVEVAVIATCFVFRYMLNVKFGGLWGI